MKRPLVAAALLAAVVTCQLAAATTAWAHAVLESSSPGDGALLDELPSEIVLTFTENVGRPAAASVTGPDGDAIQVGEVEVIDRTLRQSIDAGDPVPGVYTISYEVKSADGHPISGTSTFSIAGAPGSDVPASLGSATDDDGPDRRAVVLLFAAIAVALAVAVFAADRTARSLSGTGTA